MRKSYHLIKSQPRPRLVKRLTVMLVLALAAVIGLASASVFTVHAAQGTGVIRAQGIQLVAGPDGASNPNTYPSAAVTVSPNHDSAEVALSLFPSQKNTPQPATYYTNLLQITNSGNSNHTINEITVSDITGASNLGSLTIYYYMAQTDNPQNAKPTGSSTLTSASTGTTVLFSGKQTLMPSAVNYVEIVGYASPNAAVDSTVSFTLTVNWT